MQVTFFGYLVVPELFAEKTSFSPITLTCHLSQKSIDVFIYFWTPNSSLLSILMPVLYCLDYHSFVASFRIWNCDCQLFCLFV